MIRLTIITGLLAMRAGRHLLTITLLLISPYIFPQEKSMNLDENISKNFYTQEVKGQIEIQIKNRDFFLGLKPWKDGKLVTVDGWGQFSSFEITEKNKININKSQMSNQQQAKMPLKKIKIVDKKNAKLNKTFNNSENNSKNKYVKMKINVKEK